MAATATPQDAVDVLLERMGETDRRLGKRLLGLSQRFPGGSLPEWITYDWLTRNDVPFQYQTELYGGRQYRGGILPDFVVFVGGAAMAAPNAVDAPILLAHRSYTTPAGRVPVWGVAVTKNSDIDRLALVPLFVAVEAFAVIASPVHAPADSSLNTQPWMI